MAAVGCVIQVYQPTQVHYEEKRIKVTTHIHGHVQDTVRTRSGFYARKIAPTLFPMRHSIYTVRTRHGFCSSTARRRHKKNRIMERFFLCRPVAVPRPSKESLHVVCGFWRAPALTAFLVKQTRGDFALEKTCIWGYFMRFWHPIFASKKPQPCRVRVLAVYMGGHH